MIILYKKNKYNIQVYRYLRNWKSYFSSHNNCKLLTKKEKIKEKRNYLDLKKEKDYFSYTKRLS